MGCGGSRADAIEPRYYESWTRETESTWLTSTDAENPLPGLGQGQEESIPAAASPPEKKGPPRPGIREDGMAAQNCITVSSTGSAKHNAEGLKKINSATQCGKQAVHSTGTMTQKQKSVFRTAETKWDTKRASKKEVAMNVTKSIRQVDSNGRITENCVK
ncbi:brain and acute leukemia cytoplasmic protein [Rhinatrema bivittatum]|uniref:brain and acute leukemia cytoplasmic protein n=1 Tax=Rhinatrema bivittatum TaxID=194408 RepID=UPI00112848E9|nr:brain and acute leukemia cytoplasmic protein [Rhinatrema bivittatum]